MVFNNKSKFWTALVPALTLELAGVQRIRSAYAEKVYDTSVQRPGDSKMKSSPYPSSFKANNKDDLV